MIEVFKTSIGSEREAAETSGKLREMLPGSRISFDLEDCDRILRIEAPRIVAGEICALLTGLGYECETLE